MTVEDQEMSMTHSDMQPCDIKSKSQCPIQNQREDQLLKAADEGCVSQSRKESFA